MNRTKLSNVLVPTALGAVRCGRSTASIGPFCKNRRLAGVCCILFFATTPLFADYEVDALSGSFAETATVVPLRQAVGRKADSHAKKPPRVSPDAKPFRKTATPKNSDFSLKAQPATQRTQGKKQKEKPKEKTELMDGPKGISAFSKESALDHSQPVIQVPKTDTSAASPKDRRKSFDDLAKVLPAGQEAQNRGILGRKSFRVGGGFFAVNQHCPPSEIRYMKNGAWSGFRQTLSGFELEGEGWVPISKKLELCFSLRHGNATRSNSGSVNHDPGVGIDGVNEKCEFSSLSADGGFLWLFLPEEAFNPYAGAGVCFDKVEIEFEKECKWRGRIVSRGRNLDDVISETYVSPFVNFGFEWLFEWGSVLFDARFVIQRDQKDSETHDDYFGSNGDDSMFRDWNGADGILSGEVFIPFSQTLSLVVHSSASLQSRVYTGGCGLLVQF